MLASVGAALQCIILKESGSGCNTKYEAVSLLLLWVDSRRNRLVIVTLWCFAKLMTELYVLAISVAKDLAGRKCMFPGAAIHRYCCLNGVRESIYAFALVLSLTKEAVSDNGHIVSSLTMGMTFSWSSVTVATTQLSISDCFLVNHQYRYLLRVVRDSVPFRCGKFSWQKCW